MNDTSRRNVVICLIDLLAVLTAFYFCRYLEGYPRWHWLVVSGLAWTAVSIGSNKLRFEEYHRISVAVRTILTVDLLIFFLIVESWRIIFPDRCGGHQHWPLFLVLSAFEILFYLLYRRLVLKKIPFLYEDFIIEERYEPSLNKGIKLEEHKYRLPDELDEFILSLRQSGWKSAEEVCSPRLTVCGPRFNDIRFFNTYLEKSNSMLEDGGCLVLHGETSGIRKAEIYRDNPAGLRDVIFVVDYIWSRVIPKLHLTGWLYRAVNRGHNRNFTRVEVLGRLCRAGFSIAGEDMSGGQYTVTAVKTSSPITDDKPNCGPVIRLKRIGYRGRMIGVLKLRTMYAYSEYLQKYTYERLGLEKGGKFQDDFRVNFWGRLFRSTWVDELPMIYNWIAGDLKLVGVRPLSRHYFSLYTPQMQELRISVKPGLIPPFYFEECVPDTIGDVQESERKYIEAYKQAPFRTDVRYFFGSLRNIIFRKRRSR